MNYFAAKVQQNNQMCKIFCKKNSLCLYKRVFLQKILSVAGYCDCTFGGIAKGKAASEGTTKICVWSAGRESSYGGIFVYGRE